MDVYGGLYIDGKAVRAGAELAVVDGDGVICGRTVVRNDGEYGFLHVYSDDPRTDADEGAEPGEALHVLLDGTEPGVAPSIAWSGGHAVLRIDLKLSSGPTGVALDRPHRFALYEARPNPFNPSTTLRYELAAEGPVSIAVYGLLGRPVRTLVDGYGAMGIHRAVWDGRDDAGREVASGTYLVRFRAGGIVQARRVTLVR